MTRMWRRAVPLCCGDLAQTRASYAHDVMKDAADAEEKAGELSAQLSGARRRSEETVLTAPISGTVQQLAVHTVGGVVTPAQALLTVVPDDGPAMTEATVENKDVGFVHAGQEVEVKVETFAFTRYGLMHGRVLDVSRDAAAPGKAKKGDAELTDDGDTDDAAKPTKVGYVAHLAPDRESLVVNGVPMRLKPGLAVTAEIKTGRRSVISYLLSPLARSTADAVHER